MGWLVELGYHMVLEAFWFSLTSWPMGYMLQVVTVGHPGISPGQYSGYNNHQCSWAEMGLVPVPGQSSSSRLLLISEWLTQKGRHMIPP